VVAMTGADDPGTPGELVRVMSSNATVYITMGVYSKDAGKDRSFITWVLWCEGPVHYTRAVAHFARGGSSLWKP
jgi:hypothetical protein